MAKTNCAIYVRKSTEYGLEQEFNSLNNQEEACRAYITSQAFNDWQYYRTYTDGGISGGTMARPALQEMICDIKRGKIQCVLVYKVDRLSRSIMDFHKMMQEFEKHNCAMVSITQSFDTSTSMGKLTLNMLLSFAQFEREVSAERVRDKIRASKAKGLWTGGIPHLGYDIVDKKLIPNKVETRQITTIFEKYLELKSIDALYRWATENGFKNKEWKTATGRTMGGSPIAKNSVHRILNNRMYIGQIMNKKTGECFAGQHKAIISNELFDAVQELLKQNNNRNTDECVYNQFLLQNKIIDAGGNIFKNQSSSKNKKNHYRYYSLNEKYLPVGDVEKITRNVVSDLLNSDLSGLLPDDKIMVLKSINKTTQSQDKFLGFFIRKIIYTDNNFTYFLNPNIPCDFQAEYFNDTNKPITDKTYISTDGDIIVEKDIIINNRVSTNRYEACGKSIVTRAENATHLIKAMAYSHRYNKMLIAGMSVEKIRYAERTSPRTVYKYLNLCYLSPKIINSIIGGNAPMHNNLQELFRISSTYMDFDKQEKEFFGLND